MRVIARSWPNLYRKVYKLHRLPTVRSIKQADIKRKVQSLECDAANLQLKLFKIKAEFYKLRV